MIRHQFSKRPSQTAIRPPIWTTVVAFGRYQELTDASADSAARNRARELFEKRREWWLPAAGKLASSEHPIPVVYRIRIDRLSGRRAAKT